MPAHRRIRQAGARPLAPPGSAISGRAAASAQRNVVAWCAAGLGESVKGRWTGGIAVETPRGLGRRKPRAPAGAAGSGMGTILESKRRTRVDECDRAKVWP